MKIAPQKTKSWLRPWLSTLISDNANKWFLLWRWWDTEIILCPFQFRRRSFTTAVWAH